MRRKLKDLKAVSAVIKFWERIRNKVSEKFREPMKFLEDGRKGGIISCLIFAVQFLYTALYSFGNSIIEKIMFIILETLAVFLAAELVHLILRLIFGRAKRSRIYFLLSWVILLTCNIGGNHGKAVVPAVIVTCVVTLAVDLLGRCIGAWIRRRRMKLKSAYVMLGVSLLIVCGFGAFYHLDCFGQDRIEGYLSEKSESDEALSGSEEYLKDEDKTLAESNEELKDEDKTLAENDEELKDEDKTLAESDEELKDEDKTLAESDEELKDEDKTLAENDEYLKTEDKVVAGFDAYLEDGDETVGFLEYGNEVGKDIITGTVNLSAFAGKRGIVSRFEEWMSGYSMEEAPIAGAIWYPEDKENCPTLFIVHGNHDYRTESYLGYDYLGQYLASNGYVVVSVDENIINALGTGNNARAVLLLENIKKILQQNYNEMSPLYHKIDADRIVIGGHSRGGEIAATAYCFNELDAYPENGNLTFYYHFNISGVIAIAPTVDQYMPAGHAVELTDVNYLVIHGSNDHDVTDMMGEKQYNNVAFTGETEETYFKSSVYIMGANHGQFNTQWGRYDLTNGLNGFLNTCNLLESEEQQRIAKAYIRAFMDKVLCNRTRYADLLEDNERYGSSLPETVYITNYRDSDETLLGSFDSSINPKETDGADISCTDMKKWGLKEDTHGDGGEGENRVLSCEWNEGSDPVVEIDVQNLDLEGQNTNPDTQKSDSETQKSDSEIQKSNLEAWKISFRLSDMREDSPDRTEPLTFTVELEDRDGNIISAQESIYPTLALQLYKEDVIFNCYEYKHQMQTVKLASEDFEGSRKFDAGSVAYIRIRFDGSEAGQVMLDEIYL